MGIQEDRELKTTISVKILGHCADLLDMNLREYGSVYDSEKHERLLNEIMEVVRRD